MRDENTVVQPNTHAQANYSTMDRDLHSNQF